MTQDALQPKQIPARKGEQIIPPEPGFPFFEQAERVPFDFRDSQLKADSAWWMAEFSRLAYVDRTRAQRELARVGLPGFYWKSAGSTQLFIAHNDDFVVLAYRGTEVKRLNGLEDVFTDVDADLVRWSGPFGASSGASGAAKVHDGFAKAFASVFPGDDGVQTQLATLRAERPTRPLFVTGHSLGAGLATLTAARLGSALRALYTFGSPRVGNAAFVRQVHVPNYRFVHNNDWVPHVAPRNPLAIIGLSSYEHLGRLRYIAADSRVHDNPTLSQQLVLGVQGAIAYQLEAASALFASVDRGLGRLSPRLSIPFDMFADHAIVLYSLHLWNHLVATRRASSVHTSAATSNPRRAPSLG